MGHMQRQGTTDLAQPRTSEEADPVFELHHRPRARASHRAAASRPLHRDHGRASSAMAVAPGGIEFIAAFPRDLELLMRDSPGCARVRTTYSKRKIYFDFRGDRGTRCFTFPSWTAPVRPRAPALCPRWPGVQRRRNRVRKV